MPLKRDQQGGAEPLAQTTCPGCAGTITVVVRGGVLLLKLRHPPSAAGSSSTKKYRRICFFLLIKRQCLAVPFSKRIPATNVPLGCAASSLT
jgi:hypothetical protein